uniref:WGS project CAEQ00000000 data, annotated contig 1163 n=1 Tax=Trypanosoma congolense (strain IL3000) TaxID=1068625 RepID=F9W4A8_TRYCI|nr:unnamed protein product [Trypanosoma congolense IL3000]
MNKVPVPPRGGPPAKIPVKVPFVVSRIGVPLAVPNPVARKRKTDSDEQDEDDAILGISQPSKKLKSAASVRRTPTDSETSSSDDTDSDYSESDESSASSTTDKGSESSSAVSDDELTFFRLALRKGLLNKENAQVEDPSQVEEQPVGAPPRPPVVRSFPRDIEATLKRYEDRLNREENMIRIKDDNKTVSLGTSKVNYIDPRIVCSWAKEHNVPITKIFSSTLQKKFPWAMEASDFSF